MEHFIKTVQVAKSNEILRTKKQYLEYCVQFGAHPEEERHWHTGETSRDNQDNQGSQTYDVWAEPGRAD